MKPRRIICHRFEVRDLPRQRKPQPALSSAASRISPGCGKGGIVLLVRDPYWLHAYWEIAPAAVQRAEIGMGERPIRVTPPTNGLGIVPDLYIEKRF